MGSQKARIIGWILRDGHIHSKRNMITVVQKYKSVLKKLIPDFQDEFRMGCSHFGVYIMNNCWRLRIGSAFIKFVFTELYGIPAGCKYSKIRLPPILFNTDHSTRMFFLTAVIEGDGSFTFAKAHGKTYSMVSFQLRNETFVHSLCELFKDMGFHPAKCGSRIRGDYGILLKRGNEVFRFIQDALLYMVHEIKKRRALEHLEILEKSG
ncbi:hypothetical protein AKJ57_04410 [candidate division MSBL1 archaeon SCGC-AAA259A05]|uniref:DOD-type homing endonuclease domain-containing protein n=1 Tax=candidate division MSBL1 archaeon SCGC-AAA259A05 TaxID=1698259 RepID=A0A133U7F8_9EURY|nr:hypothetical protein AKJ57_04410 [candidate division MSBL1 archaeon SCGC-AAA259A05]